jgi:hypothetical protein
MRTKNTFISVFWAIKSIGSSPFQSSLDDITTLLLLLGPDLVRVSDSENWGVLDQQAPESGNAKETLYPLTRAGNLGRLASVFEG